MHLNFCRKKVLLYIFVMKKSIKLRDRLESYKRREVKNMPFYPQNPNPWPYQSFSRPNYWEQSQFQPVYQDPSQFQPVYQDPSQFQPVYQDPRQFQPVYIRIQDSSNRTLGQLFRDLEVLHQVKISDHPKKIITHKDLVCGVI